MVIVSQKNRINKFLKIFLLASLVQFTLYAILFVFLYNTLPEVEGGIPVPELLLRVTPVVIIVVLAISLIGAFIVSLNDEITKNNKLEAERAMFFSSAAHELKTPLSIIDGQLSGMIDGVKGYEDRDKYLKKCLENVHRMEDTVKSVLTISRLQVGSAALSENLNISSIITELMNIYGDAFDNKNIIVDINVSNNLFVTANHELIKDALGAYISNACNYSPSGADVFINASIEGPNVVITIENTGARIDDEHLSHLYEAFYRTDKSRNSNTGGSGLGLYLVKLVSEMYSGNCRTENVDKGVKSTLILPVSKNSTQNT